MSKVKPFSISKAVVWEAYKRVKANKGAAGVDGETIAKFEEDLKNNLYRLWNRMSSGSYYPPPVRLVEIPKGDGRTRPLGIPTVSDRIGQMVVKLYLEPEIEPHFHPDSYGYRPGKSALDAVGVARKRCWWFDWVVDLDIKGFFDNIDHTLMMRAVRKHTDCTWILLYIDRWLKAPVQRENGEMLDRDRGTPQGSVISPLLANLFLHYVFDEWMKKICPRNPFERYADDIIVHCVSEQQAKWIKTKIDQRMKQCMLELHPEKTKIVYCKDGQRGGNYPHEKFDFLGYTFRPRTSKTRSGKYFVNFSPAMSNAATKKVCSTIRSWRFHRRSDKSLEDLSRICNSIVRGWINYYGQYYKSALRRPFYIFNCILRRWAMRKYKKLKGRPRRAVYWLGRLALRQPGLFAHWQFGCTPTAGQ
ncbi:MAG: group II intron reverse transcriptase/maturase [Nitrospiraceae bacterium]|nr:MAG: group II intron reverse transcriptase/maturase [Nitrospiraceae bacterium]